MYNSNFDPTHSNSIICTLVTRINSFEICRERKKSERKKNKVQFQGDSKIKHSTVISIRLNQNNSKVNDFDQYFCLCLPISFCSKLVSFSKTTNIKLSAMKQARVSETSRS